MELKTNIKDSILSDPNAVHKAIQILWKEFPDYEKARENMFVLYLTTKNKLLCVELHCQGTVDTAIMYPREIIRKALFSNASGIILIHNHPSNTNIPSDHDRRVTDKIQEACKLMDIHLLDHLIISDDKEYYSFQAEGLI